VSARKIGFLILVLLFGGVVETAWRVREQGFVVGPEGCRVLGGRFYGPSFTFEEAREAALPEVDAPLVEVRNEFGDVTVEPGDGPTAQIHLRKVVYLSSEERARELADQIELRVETDGDRLRVRTNREDVSRRDVGFETHLEVRVPPRCRIDVRGDHGNALVRGLAEATVRNSFGEVQVDDVAGPVSVEGRQGAVHVSGAGADLRIDARHGEVELERVKGPAVVKSEHGSVQATTTAGLDVRMAFGEFRAEGVQGDLSVVSSHGAIYARDVAGRASAETSFAEIRLHDVAGDAKAKTRHGEVGLGGIGGSVVAETSHGAVSLDRVDGPAEVSTESGGVDARSLAQGAKIRARGGDVIVDEWRGPLDVVAERGQAHLTTAAPIVDAVSARAMEVSLDVPPGSRFDLDAESERGELRLDLPALETVSPDQKGRSRATATVGGGGATVRLRGEGDVVVESRGAAATPAEAE
jgi:hypothetical protein